MKRKTSRRIKTRELLRPEQICTQVLGDDLDYYYSKFSIIFTAKGKTIPNWPDFCFAPIGCFFPFVFNENPDVDAPVLAEKVNLVSRIAGLIPWSISKSIFRFSPTLFEYLIESGTPEKLPSQVLRKLPFWSIYIETPILADSVCVGFFAYLESNEGNDELRLILDTKAGPISLFLHLVEGNLDDSFEKATRLIKPQLELMNRANPDFDLAEMKDYSIHVYKTLLPLVLYICAENAEIKGNDSYAARLEKFQKIDVLNLKEAERPTIWNVENFEFYDVKKGETVRRASGPPNARSDKLRRFQYWTEGLLHRRCIVPATSYWEWPDDPDEYKAGKVYQFHFKNWELMAFPAIICPYKNKEDEQKFGVMTITFDAEPHAKEIHRTQPALLLRENYDDWLNPNTETPERYLYKAKGIELDYELDEDPPWPTKKIKPEVSKKDSQPRLFE